MNNLLFLTKKKKSKRIPWWLKGYIYTPPPNPQRSFQEEIDGYTSLRGVVGEGGLHVWRFWKFELYALGSIERTFGTRQEVTHKGPPQVLGYLQACPQPGIQVGTLHIFSPCS